MRIPVDAIIPDDKITRYLLVQKARNDKSKFLAKAGFTMENPESLKDAIQSPTKIHEAIKDGDNELWNLLSINRRTGWFKWCNLIGRYNMAATTS